MKQPTVKKKPKLREGDPRRRGIVRSLHGQVLSLFRPADRDADDAAGLGVRPLVPAARRGHGLYRRGHWYLLVHTTCKHLQADNRCGIYHTRPQICRDYSTDNCEYEDDWVYDHISKPPSRSTNTSRPCCRAKPGASIRSPKPPLLPVCEWQRVAKPRIDRRESNAPYRTAHAQGLSRLSARGDDSRERLIDTARRVYRSYGFSPIDTPALEYLEILTGKGSDETDKQLYRFEDQGERGSACGSI